MTVDASDLRAADADREAVANILRAQCAAGRLDVSKLEERLSAALVARTLGELERLLADLPGGRSAARVPARERAKPHTVGLPGLRRFHYVDVFDRDRPTTFSRALAASSGFRSACWPWPTRTPQRIVVTFDELGPNRTRLTSAGLARRPVRRAFAGLAG